MKTNSRGRLNVHALPAMAGALIWVSMLAGAGVGHKQPPESRPAASAQAEPPAAERPGREQVRQRLREELQASRDRADAAIKRIDEGADPVQVREQMDRDSGGRGPWRAGRGLRNDGKDRDGPEGNDRRSPRPFGSDSPFELTPEEREQMLRFLEEHAPRVGAKLREMDGATPDVVTRLITRMRPRLREVMEAGPGDPAGHELRLTEFRSSLDVMWARRAADEARKSGDSGAHRARRDELRTALAAHFDAQVALQEHEADRLARRVEKLRADLQDRRASKDRIVDRELEGPARREGVGERSPDGPPR